MATCSDRIPTFTPSPHAADGLRDRTSALQVLLNHLGEGPFEPPSPLAVREDLQPEPDFEDRDGGRPDRFRGLGVQPSDDFRTGLTLHERREDIRVQQDHEPRSAGRGA